MYRFAVKIASKARSVAANPSLQHGVARNSNTQLIDSRLGWSRNYSLKRDRFGAKAWKQKCAENLSNADAVKLKREPDGAVWGLNETVEESTMPTKDDDKVAKSNEWKKKVGSFGAMFCGLLPNLLTAVALAPFMQCMPVETTLILLMYYKSDDRPLSSKKYTCPCCLKGRQRRFRHKPKQRRRGPKSN